MSAIEETVQTYNKIKNKLDNSDYDDKELIKVMQLELDRQKNSIELIASENFVSTNVLKAQGSVLTNKYAEGYPGKRYYGGCDFVDVAEKIAIERACKLFSCKWANVQPHSGSQANQAVYMALINPGDKILGMSLSAGGHLTHGAIPNQSGKWFEAIHYGVKKEDGLIDYDEMEKIAFQHKPKLIIAGASAYSRQIDFERFRDVANNVGAYFMADIAHYAGLIVTGVNTARFGTYGRGIWDFIMDDESIIAGDVNLDEIVNIQDLILLVNFILGIDSPSDEQFNAGNINGDEILNILDIIEMVNIILDS